MSQTLTTDVPPAAAVGRAPMRADIQGLRALAVVAVILNHLVGWPAGGFVGVDVFFVISGFLITGMLLRDYEVDGRVSLARFYGRRIKRIVPAALVVLAVTAIGAHFLFNTAREWSTLWDAGYALVFLANWHFGAIGTNYFHATTAVSPLQHYWSLSVEEQFYLVWPGLVAIVLAIAAAGAANRKNGRVVVGVIATIVVVASFAYAMAETKSNPTFAYFSTLSRAWELGAGALLAALVPVLARMPLPLRFIAGWAGLLGIVYSLFRITSTVAFPGPWAALPVIAAALVIAGGVGGPQRYLFPLHNPVSVYLGTISYSLYLWHAPVIAFLLILVPTQTAVTTGVVAALIVAISVVAFYLVEQPFHRSPLFESFGGSAERRHAAWESWRDRVGSQIMAGAVGLAVVALAVVLISGNALHGESPLAASANSQVVESQLQADLASATTATAWPQLSPTLNDVMVTTTLDNAARGCFDLGAMPNVASCTWGLSSAPHHMYLVGDSTALAYAPAFKAMAEASAGQWKITTVGLFGCRFTDVLVQSDDPDAVNDCTARKAAVAQQINADKPDLVVVSNTFSEGVAADGSALPVAALVASTVTETAKYNAPGRLVYLAPPPLGADLGQCYNAVSTPQSCTVPVDATWTDFAAQTEAAEGAGNHFVTSLPFSCFNGLCPPFAGTIPTKYDRVHMTVAYAVHVAPAIRNQFVALGLM